MDGTTTMQHAAELKERGNSAFRRSQYEEALGLYHEAIALFPSCTAQHAELPPSLQAEGAIETLTLLNSNAAESALRLGQWHAAIELSDAALLASAGHQKSAARKRRAELAWTLHNSLPEGAGTDAEVQRAVKTLSQLLLPDLFDQMARAASLYNGSSRADDRNVDLMCAMTPSLHDAMHQTIVEAIDKTEAEDGPLFLGFRLANHLLSLALRGKLIDNPTDPTIRFYNPERILKFIQTGVSLSSPTN